MNDVDTVRTVEQVKDFIGIRNTLDRYGDLLLRTFTYNELLLAYGPVFEVWYAQQATHISVFKERKVTENYPYLATSCWK